MQEIKIGAKYKHYKGNIYTILYFAKHSETMEDMIVYKSVKTGEVWTRPYKMWNEIVDDNKTLRFTLLD